MKGELNLLIGDQKVPKELISKFKNEDESRYYRSRLRR